MGFRKKAWHLPSHIISWLLGDAKFLLSCWIMLERVKYFLTLEEIFCISARSCIKYPLGVSCKGWVTCYTMGDKLPSKFAARFQQYMYFIILHMWNYKNCHNKVSSMPTWRPGFKMLPLKMSVSWYMYHSISWTRKSHSSATTGKEVTSLARSLWCRSNIAARLCCQLCRKFWSSSSILITSILCLERSCSEGSGPNDNLGVGLVSKSSKVMLADPDLTPVITNDFSHYLFVIDPNIFCNTRYDLRASLCKILISSFAHKMDFAHNFSVDFF